ncbi:hypothetical protein PsorP6_006974 [Peronosclerospora sorghi]|uniref:Uncharacterized protein n=1 Tax=Peronosclerospora sorghi TaxID=230839 RepID=A0ACC0W835_9STRA|nr:hypothetical protein PsorP6_006974 [Peronosclerospora sorghi]
MSSSEAVDEAIRTLTLELSTKKDTPVLGKTEAESKVVATYAEKVQRRATLGAFAGSSSVLVGLWKFSKNPNKLVGAFFVLTGGLVGASYGVITIRRHFLMDLLMLPSDQSPFATHARSILMTKIPNNTFVQELNEKLGKSYDSWNENPNSSDSVGLSPSSLTRGSCGSDNEIPSTIPPITGIDTPRRTEQDPSDEALSDSKDKERQFPFFFGAKPSSDDAMNAEERNDASSRDTFARQTRKSRRSEFDKNAAPLRHDEDDYFFGVSNKTEVPAQYTTWEEIRRRAAERRK